MKHIFPQVFIQPDISRFVQIKSPTENKQASDKEGNLFWRCHFNKRERQQKRGGERARRKRRRAQGVTAHGSEICRISYNYPGPGKDC